MATAALFSGTALRTLTATEVASVFADAPHIELPRADVVGSEGVSVLEVSVASGLFATKKEAKRTITAGGLYLNNERVETAGERLLVNQHLIDDAFTLLRKGKKAQMLVQWI